MDTPEGSQVQNPRANVPQDPIERKTLNLTPMLTRTVAGGIEVVFSLLESCVRLGQLVDQKSCKHVTDLRILPEGSRLKSVLNGLLLILCDQNPKQSPAYLSSSLVMESQQNAPDEHAPSIEEATSPPSKHDKEAWYTESVTAIPADARQLLERYSNIAPDQVIPHVLALRDKAFSIWSYACIGQLRFLSPNLSHLPVYPRVLDRLRAGATFCDAGCCFGQELRYLVHTADVPSTQLHGFDLEPRFTEMGYELFRDRDSLHATFLAGDLLAVPGSPEAGGLDALVGKMDVVFASSLLHVWDWDNMLAAAKRLASLAKPKAGAMVVGRQLGSTKAGSCAMPTKQGRAYRHDVESISRFWGQVGAETGVRWRVEGGLYEGEELRGNQGHSWSEPNMRMIWFAATRE